MRSLISILLLAAIGASYYLVNDLVAAEVEMPANNSELPDANPENLQLDSIAAYQSITGRPLFDEDRKPAEVVVEPKVVRQAPVEKQLMVQAIGIAVSGESLLAVVKELRSGAILKLKINDEIDGWALKSVSDARFIFAKDEREKVVEFKNNGE